MMELTSISIHPADGQLKFNASKDPIFEAYFSAEKLIDLDTVTEVRIGGNLIWSKDS